MILKKINLLVLILFCLLSTEVQAFRANLVFWNASSLLPFTWIGKGGDANWTTTANWYGGVVPGSAQVAIFEDNSKTACGANCSPTINTSINLKGVLIKSGYSGSITQASGNSIAIGVSGWIQETGTFIGGNSDITVIGDFLLSGGTFTSTSGTLNFPGSGVGSYTTISDPSYFIHHSGTVSFGMNLYADGAVTSSVNNVDFFNVMVGRYSGYRIVTFTTSFNVRGLLNINAGEASDGGTINAYGNILLTSNGFRSTTIVNVLGNANQSLTGGGLSAPIQTLNIQKTGGTLTLIGTIAFSNSLTYVSGTVNAGTSSVSFGTSNYWDSGIAVNIGSVHLNNVLFNIYNASRPVTITGTLYVDGNLSFDGGNGLSGGTIEVQGNTNFITDYAGNNSLITFSGNNAQTITVGASGHTTSGNWTVAKSGGSLTLASNVLINSASQSLSITTGSLDMAGYNFTIGNSLSLSANTLTKNAGVLTVNGVVAGTGSLFGGTVAP